MNRDCLIGLGAILLSGVVSIWTIVALGYVAARLMGWVR